MRLNYPIAIAALLFSPLLMVAQDRTSGVQVIATEIQLVGEAHGIDFTPYLQQISLPLRTSLTSVVRLPEPRRVVIQGTILRNGKISKLTLLSQSGDKPLDQAALAALVLATPFPMFPGDFDGDRIVVQFTFAGARP
jgi:TonB family protein